jgi:hypothetical protein
MQMSTRLEIASFLEANNQLVQAEALLEEMLDEGIQDAEVLEKLAGVSSKIGKKVESVALLEIASGKATPGGSDGFYALLYS